MPEQARHLLYLVGQPGSGKSTLADLLVTGLEGLEATDPFAHIVFGDVVLLGAAREAFSGTDALSMSVQPKVIAWLRQTRHQYVLGEGDRLANSKFFQAVVDAGWDLRIAYLSVPAAVAERRRWARCEELGVGPQDPKWIKGRQTKARRLAEEWGDRLYRLNATNDPLQILGELRRCSNSVVSRLDAARAAR